MKAFNIYTDDIVVKRQNVVIPPPTTKPEIVTNRAKSPNRFQISKPKTNVSKNVPVENASPRRKVFDPDTIEKMRVMRSKSASKWLKEEKEKQQKATYEQKLKAREIITKQMESDRQALRNINTNSSNFANILNSPSHLQTLDESSSPKTNSSFGNVVGRSVPMSSGVLSSGIAVSNDGGSHSESRKENQFARNSAHIEKENIKKHSNVDREVPKLSAVYIDSKSLLEKYMSVHQVSDMNISMASIPSPGVEIKKRRQYTENDDSNSDEEPFFYAPNVSASIPKAITDSPQENEYDDDWKDDTTSNKKTPAKDIISLKCPGSDESTVTSIDPIVKKVQDENEKRREAARLYLSKQRQKHREDRENERLKQIEDKLNKKIKLAELDKKRRESLRQKIEAKAEQDGLDAVNYTNRLVGKPEDLIDGEIQNPERNVGNVILQSPPGASKSIPRYADIVDDVLNEYRQSLDLPVERNPKLNKSVSDPASFHIDRSSIRNPLEASGGEIPRSLSDIPRPYTNSSQDGTLPVRSKSPVSSMQGPSLHMPINFNELPGCRSNSTGRSRSNSRPFISTVASSSFNSWNNAVVKKRPTTPSRFMMPTTSSGNKIARSSSNGKNRRSPSINKKRSKRPDNEAVRRKSTDRSRLDGSMDRKNKTKSKKALKKKEPHNIDRERIPDTGPNNIKQSANEYSDRLLDEIKRLEDSIMHNENQHLEVYDRKLIPEQPMKIDAVAANVRNVKDVLAEVDRMSSMLRELTRDLEQQVSATTSVRDSIDLDSIAQSSTIPSISGYTSRTTASRSLLRQSLADKIEAVLASVYQKDHDEADSDSESSKEDERNDDSEVSDESEDRGVNNQLNQSSRISSPSKDENYSLRNKTFEDSDLVRMDESDDDINDASSDISLLMNESKSVSHPSYTLLNNDVIRDPYLRQQLGAVQDQHDILNRFNSDLAINNLLNESHVPETLSFHKDSRSSIDQPFSENITEPLDTRSKVAGDLIYFSKASSDRSPTSKSVDKEDYEPNLRNVGAIASLLNTNNDAKWKLLDEEKNIEWSEEEDDDPSDMGVISMYAKKIIDQKRKDVEEEKEINELKERLPKAQEYIQEQDSLHSERRPGMMNDQPSPSKVHEDATLKFSPINTELPSIESFWDTILKREQSQSNNNADGMMGDLAWEELKEGTPNETSYKPHDSHFDSVPQKLPEKKRSSAADMRLLVIDELRRQEELMKTAVELSDLQQAHTLQTAAELLQRVVMKNNNEISESKRQQELALQQQAYEISLSSALHVAQYKLQEEGMMRDHAVDKLTNEMFLETMRSNYELLLSQAAATTRNLEQASELLALEQSLPTTRPPRPPSAVSVPIKVSNMTSSNKKSDDRRLKSSYSHVSEARASLDDSSVLYGDDEVEEDTMPSTSLEFPEDDGYSMSFEEEKSKLSDPPPPRKKLNTTTPKEVIAAAREMVKTVNSSYSDTFDHIEEVQSVADESDNLPQSYQNKRKSFDKSQRESPRISMSYESSNANKSYQDSFESLDMAEVNRLKSVESKGTSKILSSPLPASLAPLSNPVIASIAAYRHDLDDVISSYRYDLNERLKSYEKTFDMKLDLISKRHQKQLDFIRSDKAMGNLSINRFQEEEIANEEFASSKAKLERDRWAVYARAYKDLKQVKKLKRKADVNQNNLLQASLGSRIENYDDSSSDTGDSALDDLRLAIPTKDSSSRITKQSPKKSKRSTTRKKITKSKKEDGDISEEEPNYDKENFYDDNSIVEEEESHRKSYRSDSDDEVSEDDEKDDKFVQSVDSEDDEAYSSDSDSSASSYTADSTKYSNDFEAAVESSNSQHNLSKSATGVSALRDKFPADLDPALKELDSSIDRRRKHIENIKKKIDNLRGEREKLHKFHQVQEILKAKQDERARLIDIESDLIEQYKLESLQLEKDKDELLRSTELLVSQAGNTSPKKTDKLSGEKSLSLSTEHVDKQPKIFEQRELMSTWKKGIETIAQDLEEDHDSGLSDDSFVSGEDFDIKSTNKMNSNIMPQNLLDRDNLLVRRAEHSRAAIMIQSVIRMYLTKTKFHKLMKKIMASKEVSPYAKPWDLGLHDIDEYKATIDLIDFIDEDSFLSVSNQHGLDEDLQTMKRTEELHQKMEKMAATVHLRDTYIDRMKETQEDMKESHKDAEKGYKDNIDISKKPEPMEDQNSLSRSESKSSIDSDSYESDSKSSQSESKSSYSSESDEDSSIHKSSVSQDDVQTQNIKDNVSIDSFHESDRNKSADDEDFKDESESSEHSDSSYYSDSFAEVDVNDIKDSKLPVEQKDDQTIRPSAIQPQKISHPINRNETDDDDDDDDVEEIQEDIESVSSQSHIDEYSFSASDSPTKTSSHDKVKNELESIDKLSSQDNSFSSNDSREVLSPPTSESDYSTNGFNQSVSIKSMNDSSRPSSRLSAIAPVNLVDELTKNKMPPLETPGKIVDEGKDISGISSEAGSTGLSNISDNQELSISQDNALDVSGNETVAWELHTPISKSLNISEKHQFVDDKEKTSAIVNIPDDKADLSDVVDPINQSTHHISKTTPMDINFVPKDADKSSDLSRKNHEDTQEDDFIALSEQIADHLLKNLLNEATLFLDVSDLNPSTPSESNETERTNIDDKSSPTSSPNRSNESKSLKNNHSNVDIEPRSPVNASESLSSLTNIPPLTIRRMPASLSTTTTFVSSIDNDDQLLQHGSPHSYESNSPIHLKPWDPNAIMPSTVVHPVSPTGGHSLKLSPTKGYIEKETIEELYDFDDNVVKINSPVALPDQSQQVITPVRKSVAVLMEVSHKDNIYIYIAQYFMFMMSARYAEL